LQPPPQGGRGLRAASPWGHAFTLPSSFPASPLPYFISSACNILM
jgi:hypothetical protein